MLKMNWKFQKTNTVHTVVNQENNGNNNACQASEASSLVATGAASTTSAKMEVDGASGAALATAEAKTANGSGFDGQKAIKKGQISKDESVSDGLCTHSTGRFDSKFSQSCSKLRSWTLHSFSKHFYLLKFSGTW